MKKMIFSLAIFIIVNSSFLANDSQSQWVEMSDGINDGHISCFAVLGTNIFAATGGGMVLSTNYGSNWISINNGLTNTWVLSLTVSGTNIFAGTNGTGVYLSPNNGASWIHTNLYQYILSLATIGDNIFAGSDNFGVWISTNYGDNWTQTTLNNRTISSLAANGNNLFAGTTGQGVYLSTNNGTLWTQTSLNNKRVRAITISGNNIYAGTDSNGVYLSSNNGANWTQIGLNNSILYSLAVSGNNIFAGILDSGVYLSTNNGTNWIQKNQGFGVIPTVNAFLFTNNYIFAGTDGLFIWRRSFSEIIGIENISTDIPTSYSLEQNYPNPFNPRTKIKFDLPKSSGVKITVFDVTGKEVAVIVNETLQAGTYQADWNASAYPSGVYFYRMQAGEFRETKRMILVK